MPVWTETEGWLERLAARRRWLRFYRLLHTCVGCVLGRHHYGCDCWCPCNVPGQRDG